MAYYDASGGLSRIATVREALSESMEANKLVEAARRFQPVTSIQRLGYLLAEVLEQKALAEPLAEHLKTVKHFPVLLRPQKGQSDSMITGNVWKVVPNVEVETDL